MKKSIRENIFIAILLVVWMVVTAFSLRIKNEFLKYMAVFGMLIVGYFVIVTCDWLAIYKEYKEQYRFIKEEDNKRRINYFQGNSNEVLICSELIEQKEYNMKDMSEYLTKYASWIPKRKLRQMIKNVDRIMNFHKRYPPI